MPKPIISTKEQLKNLIEIYDKKDLCFVLPNGIIIDKDNWEDYCDETVIGKFK